MLVPDRPAFGHCIISDKYKFISIPKCASTYGIELLHIELNWQISNFKTIDLSSKKNLVVLRNPVDRWKSAMLMYFLFPKLGVHLDLGKPKTIFDNLCFDPHTDLQVNFIKGLDLNNAIFFEFNSSLETTFVNFLEKELSYKNIKLKNKHLDKSKKEKNIIIKKLTEILDIFLDDVENKQKLYSYLKPDLDLYRSVNFYKKL